MDTPRPVVFWECCECNEINPHTSAWDAGGHEWCFASVTCDHVRCSYCKHLDKEAKPISYCDGKPLDTPGRSNSNISKTPGESERKSTGNAIYELTGRVNEPTLTSKPLNASKRISGKPVVQASGNIPGKAPGSPKPSARVVPYLSIKRNSPTTLETSHNTPGIIVDEVNRRSATNSSSGSMISMASRSSAVSDGRASDMPFQCSAQACRKEFMSLYALEQHNLKYHYQAPLHPQGADLTYFIETARQAGAATTQYMVVPTNAGASSSNFNIASHTMTTRPVCNTLTTATNKSVRSPPNPPATLTVPAFRDQTSRQLKKSPQSSKDLSISPPISPREQASPSHATFWDAVGGRRELVDTPDKSGLDEESEENTDARASPSAENLDA